MMAQTPPSSPGDRDPAITDAKELFRDDPAPDLNSPNTQPSVPTADDIYEVLGAGAPHEDEAVLSPVARLGPGVKIIGPVTETRSRVQQEPSTKVDQIWTRRAEWGPNLVLLAAITLAVWFLIYLALLTEVYLFAFYVFIGGTFILLTLSYPILITLERPVRVTPELAVRDFFDSLSHHLPHYRRMWLLLSSEGRISAYYTTYVGFRIYWGRMRRYLRRGRAAWFKPLIFKVEGFQAEKSTGKNAIKARFSLNIFRRDDDEEDPVATYRMEMGLVKGRDRMWYLDKGTIPDEKGYDGSWMTLTGSS
jgi:hypothetical protein